MQSAGASVVLGLRHGLQMARVDAVAKATPKGTDVVEMKPGRNRSNRQLVGDTVGESAPKSAIAAVLVYPSLPAPASIVPATPVGEVPKPSSEWLEVVVGVDVAAVSETFVAIQNRGTAPARAFDQFAGLVTCHVERLSRDFVTATASTSSRHLPTITTSRRPRLVPS